MQRDLAEHAVHETRAVIGRVLLCELDGLVKRDADWVEDRVVPMPTATFAQTVDLAGFFALACPIIAIRPARGDQSAAAAAEAIAAEYGFPTSEIDGGHLVMITKPDATAELIDNFARQPAALFAKRMASCHD